MKKLASAALILLVLTVVAVAFADIIQPESLRVTSGDNGAVVSWTRDSA